MATVSSKRPQRFEYPTTDGKPMAETDFHRKLMTDLIATLDVWFADEPKVYVSGNLLMYYVPGNKRKHVSPDVFVVRGVAKKDRLYYLTWKEGKTPAFVIELTSSSTRNEDKKTKFALYRDVLKVKEYFLFDPFGEYLKPRLQGYRLRNGDYAPINLVDGRMASRVIGLHLEPAERALRLYDPATGQWLPTPPERVAKEKTRADHAETRAHEAERHASQEKTRADEAAREIVALAEEKARLAEENDRQRELLEKLLGEKKNGR